MCIRSSQHFLKCCHVDTKLAHCPSYHKQEKRGSGFLGCLLQKKNKKRDCGKVVPHYLRLDAFCQACTIKSTSLRAKDVGVGAFKVQRSTVEDNFRDVRKYAVKERVEPVKRAPDNNKRPDYGEINTKPNVWIPDLYHHPDSMAKSEKYAREPAPAPPVSSGLRKISLREGPFCTPAKNRAAGTTRDGRHVAAPGTLRLSADRMPVFGNSTPLRIPAEPVPVHRPEGKFSGAESHHPPARRPPPVKPFALQESAGGKAARPSDPVRGANAASTTKSRAKNPELRHKQGRIYNVAAVRTPPVPVPEYQVYLNAMNFAAENSASDKAKLAKPMHSSPPKAKPNPPYRHTKEEPKRLGLHSIMGRMSSSKPSYDDGSDTSFVCQDSRKLSQPRSGRKVARQ